MTESTNAHAFAGLLDESFILLTTYRKNGNPVPTTVWFGQEADKLYITTSRAAGKTKRIRANPLVTVAPSDQVGNIRGATLAGRARVLSEDEQAEAIQVLRRKYGAVYDQVTGQMDATQPAGMRIFIVIEPA